MRVVFASALKIADLYALRNENSCSNPKRMPFDNMTAIFKDSIKRWN